MSIYQAEPRDALRTAKKLGFALSLLLLGCTIVVMNRGVRERLAKYFDGFSPVDAPYLHGFAPSWIEPVTWDDESPLTEQLPRRIRALDKKRISITGYMRPVEWDELSEDDRLKSFVLTPHPPGCCLLLPLHEQVFVEMEAGQTVTSTTETMVRVRGTFSLRPDIGEDGRVWLLFRMRAQSVLDIGRQASWPR